MTERLRYTKEQLGSDWEDHIWIVHHPESVNHVSIYDDVSNLIYSYGEPVPYAEKVYKQSKINPKIHLLSKGLINDVLQVSPLEGYLKSYKSKNSDVAMYKLNLSESDIKIIEKNLKNSIARLKEFKCIGQECSDSGIKTPREGGRYYLKFDEPYNVLWRNCTVYVQAQFKGTSKELDFKMMGIFPSSPRNYAINLNEKTVSSNRKIESAEVKNSSMLVYYNYNGNGEIVTMDMRNKKSDEIKKFLESLQKK